MAEPSIQPAPRAEADKPRTPWRRLDPSEIPPELADNELVQSLTTLTPEDEAMLTRAAELDALDP
jgi:hypothetical protein